MGFLKEILNKCGVRLTTTKETPNVLVQEQSLVIRDIEKRLVAGTSTEDNVRNFVSDLKSLFENRNSFRLCLLPTVLKKNDDDDAIKVNQESLMRIFLSVDELQSEVVEILIDEIARCGSEGDEEDAVSLRLCLNTLRYLPYVRNAEGVTERILDVLDIATFESRLEMLNVIPDIVPDAQSDRTARELCKLLRDAPDLTSAIVDCLNCLNLSADSKREIETSLIERLDDVDAIKNFVVLYEFLTRNCSKQSLNDILGKCRDALGEILLSNDTESASQKTIIVNKLKTSVFAKNIYEGYLNYLSRVNEHKPVDILLFTILHSAAPTKKQRVETLFKKQVKRDILKINHLDHFYQKYLTKSFIKDYLGSLIDLASNLLKDNETIEFSTTMYKLTFDNKNVKDYQRQDVIHNLIMLIGFWEIRNVSQILGVLTVLSEDTEKMKRYAAQLMLLFDKLDAYKLGDVKNVFDILCSLVCTDETHSGIKNELHILVRKQLSTSKHSLKQRGIIGSIIMAKHLVMRSESQSEVFGENESISSEDLSDNVREAIKLLELAESTCEKSTDLMGLFYDQLANVITNDDLDKYFLKWLYEKITNNFQDKYVTETVPTAIDNIEFSAQYSLNTIEEVDSDIYVNIAELTIGNSSNSIQILAPFFRLLRLLHFKENNGDLGTIDALLGCGVILPKTENLDVYSVDQLKNVADCLYHCVNWFRETISAFVTQPQKKKRRKVLQRLENLIQVQKLLDEVMEQIPEHKLPTGCFHLTDGVELTRIINVSKSGKRPKKKRKLDDTVLTLNETSKKGPKKNQAFHFEFGFREIDTDVMILLKYPLKLTTGNLEQLSPQTQQTTIDLPSFEFLLQDLIVKLNKLTKNNKELSLTNISAINPVDIVTDFVRLLPNIYNKFQLVSKRLKIILEESEFVYDHQSLFKDDANELKTTFCSVLGCLNLIFNWSGFKNPKNLKLLKDCLRGLKSTVSSSQLQSVNQLSKEFIAELDNCAEQCLNLDSAVNFIEIMQGLCTINSNNVEIKKKLALMSSKFLSRPWFDSKGELEKGKDYFTRLDILIRSYLDGANVKTLGGLIATLRNQAETLKLKEDSLEMLKSVNKTSFHVLYRNFCIYLLERVKIEIASLTNAEHLNLWKTAAVSLQDLMAILKVQESRSNLVHFLKKSVGVLKVFLSHGIPILEIVLRSKTDQAVEILRALQTTTRFLHHLCCHSKVTKDSALIAHAPQFRLTLETFIFRVKAMLVANDCSAAFWMGILRNRDLHGEDILSQNSVSTDGNGEGNDGEEEELPPDEESEENDELSEGEGSSNQETVSEAFD